MPGLSTTHAAPPTGKHLATLSVGALGIVYGDIGTSPLYALKECFAGHQPVAVTPGNVLGILSLILWSLIAVVTVKYLVFVMRADNKGEGGILALMALAQPHRSEASSGKWLLVALGLFGSALLYGDGMITPAISVLSAVEGLQIATPAVAPYVIPVTVTILVILFLVQRRGTGGIGAVFGPVMILWFGVLLALGIGGILRDPSVLRAINPLHGLSFFGDNGLRGFLTLGSVFLVVTGGEALYADMGHFGTRPIRVAWFAVVLPALVVNYFGQGALLLHDATAAANPFFFLAPKWALLPLVGLATLATVIASQALISGAFSMTRQAVQLGYMPRVKIDHTSASEIGQIYIPGINWALMACTIGLVLGFRSSSNLAAAYGIAVTLTMLITTLLLYFVATKLWKWSKPAALGLTGVFAVMEIGFFAANAVKIAHGGWFPLLVGAIVFTLLTTWKRGREILDSRLRETSEPIERLLSLVASNPPHRVPGTAVFLSRVPSGTPAALLLNLKHNHVLHETVVLLSIVTEEVPRLARDEVRTTVEALGFGVYRVISRFGFMEDQKIPPILSGLNDPALSFAPDSTTYFVAKETLLATEDPGMAIWREKLFALMSRNARNATLYFGLPSNQVVEIGSQVRL